MINRHFDAPTCAGRPRPREDDGLLCVSTEPSGRDPPSLFLIPVQQRFPRGHHFPALVRCEVRAEQRRPAPGKNAHINPSTAHRRLEQELLT